MSRLPLFAASAVLLHTFVWISPARSFDTPQGQALTERPQPGQSAATYQPMTAEERWNYYLRKNFASPGAFFRTAWPAAIHHRNDDPAEWGQGMEGYGKRLASQFAWQTVDGSLEHGTAALMGTDPRYHRCQCDGFLPRFGYAVASSFVTRTSSGGWTANVPNFVGAYGGSMIAMTWYPDRYGWKDGVREGTHQVLIGGSINVFREFWPEIKKVMPFVK